jgi:mannose/cellobiose epimerase-like protein (N-acyl-D-glucosamine 2-epimerase family)
LPFAAAAPVVGTDKLRRDARAVLDYIDRNLPHPAGGYEEGLPATRPRRQNPHMHLLEALLAAHASFRDPIYLQRSGELIDLFLTRLFQRAEGALPEYFDDQLAPVRDPNGRYLIEPGHHYEWIWLLDLYAAAAPHPAVGHRPVSKGEVPAHHASRRMRASAALLRFADRRALDPTHGLVVNELWSDGSLRTGGFRLWPQTERLKAEARRATNPDAHLAAAFTALWKHLDGTRAGLWHERLNPDGAPTADPAPATSLYHLTAALSDPAVLAYAEARP